MNFYRKNCHYDWDLFESTKVNTLTNNADSLSYA